MTESQLGMALRCLCNGMTAGGAEARSDSELLRRFCARREEAAFAALMQRHARMVWGVCRDVLRHEQDAEDAFQATFLALARQAGSIRKGEAVAAWLHGVARRIALAARRAGATRREHERRARKMPAEKPLSEDALREALGMLDDEVQALPARQRAVFVLCCLEGKSRAEAAQALGWKEGTVASTLARARQLLQQRLSRRGVTLTSALCAVVLMRQARAAAPALLARSTLRAALSYAAGHDVTAAVSRAVVALTEGATTTMLRTKVRTATVFLLALGLCAVGVGVPASREAATKADEARVAARPPQANKPVEPPPARPAAEDKGARNCEVSGLVLGPSDRPVAGARLFVVPGGAGKADLEVRATTGADGRFRMRVSRAELERDVRLLATAAEHGPDWVALGKADRTRELTLRLGKDDLPIEGRLLDLEGRPLAGIAVGVVSVEKPTRDRDLEPWLKYARLLARGFREDNLQDPGVPGHFGGLTSISPAALGLPAVVKTGKDGTFRLTGIGRERLVSLAIREESLEHADLTVLTTSTKLGKEPLAARSAGPRRVYGPRFSYSAGPSRPLVGTVRDRRTGKGIAGVLVHCYLVYDGASQGRFADGSPMPLWIACAARATTDEKGQYRIAGLGKHEAYMMVLRSPSHFQRRVTAKDAPGLEPLRTDFEMEKGIAVRGRLTDKVTGKPVRGSVSYEPLRSNPSLEDPRLNDAVAGQDKSVDTLGEDGSFALVALPGPGLLLVRAEPWDHYCRAQLDDQLRRDVADTVPGGSPTSWHTGVRINPSEKDARSRVCDIALEPGETRAGTVVGPDGKPLTELFVEGYRPVGGGLMGLKAPHFTLTGLSSHTPRPVMFYHPVKHLSKLEWVKAERGGPLTVHLEPPGTVTGRVVDARGRPVAGLDVGAGVQKDVLRDMNMPTFQMMFQSVGASKTDADGKFRLVGLLPGLKHTLSGYGKVLEEKSVVSLATGLAVKSGEVKDLGDLKIKEASREGPRQEKKP